MNRYNLEQKLETTVRTLSEWRVIDRLFPLEVEYVFMDQPSNKIPVGLDGWKKFEEPYLISKTNSYAWFRFSFDVVGHEEHVRPYLFIETFINGVACTIRPQGLLFLNGKLHQGIDINHFDVLIDKPGHYEAYMLLYTHTFAFSFPLYISLKHLDQRVIDAFYDFQVPLEALKNLDRDDTRYIHAMDILNEAMNLIDFRRRNSEEFFSSIAKARSHLKDNFYDNPEVCGVEDYMVNQVAHSHIDVAWLWDLAQTRQKVQRTFSTTMRLFEQYPEYRYMHTTPQVFEFLKLDNPELFEQVKQKSKEGRFELDGSMWLEADCNLTSGESLSRQMLYGIRFFKEEFGVEPTCLFLPDVFGYSAQIPQILRECDIEDFVTAKIGWNDTNRIPHDSFVWKGIDGSDVFTYLITVCDADPRHGIKDTTYTFYNAEMKANQILGAWNRYGNKSINNRIISIYGHGDGGGGPTAEMIEKERRYEYGMPGLGKNKISTLRNAIDEAKVNFYAHTTEATRPLIEGELYLEFHRGTYTSVPSIKKNVRKAEFALQNVEELSSFSSILLAKPYDKDEIERNWKSLLLNEFHDIVPGSSIEKVYQDSQKQFDELFEFTNGSIEESLNAIASALPKEPGILVYNPNGFEANDLINVDGTIYYVEGIPSFGYKLVKPTLSRRAVKVDDQTIENDFFKLVLDEDGSIVSLFDKQNQKELVKKGDRLNKLVSYEDMPYEYDNWELTPYHFQKPYKANGTASFEMVDEGDAKGIVVTIPYYDSLIRQKILLYSDVDRVDFVTDIDWKEKRQVLKAEFPFDNHVESAKYDIQFGNIQRTTRPKDSWDEAKFETVGQKWVDMSNDEYGVAILNDAKYGYGTDGDKITITLVKGGSFPYDGASDYVPTFTYSIYPHKASEDPSKIIRQAYMLNRPLLVKKSNGGSGRLKESFSLLDVDNSSIMIETLKKAEDGNGYVIRMYESSGRPSNATIRFNFPLKEVRRINILEKDKSVISLSDSSITLEVKPFEIITLKVR